MVGLVLSAVACVRIRAQGVLQFENMSVAIHRAPIYNTDTCLCAKTGNTVNGIPTGSQTYSGAQLSGSGFTIELWAAPSDAPDSALAPVAQTTFKTGASAGFIFPVIVSVPPVAPGGTLKCQARAWNNVSGTLTSWSQAQCAGTQAGTSAIFTAGPIPVSGTALTTNLRSFCLVQLEAPLQALFLTLTRNDTTTVLDRFGVNHLLSGDDTLINATGPALQSASVRLQWRKDGLDFLVATNATPPSMSQPRVDAQGKFFATVVAAPFRTVTIRTSTNLSAWTDVATGTADAAGNFEFSQTFPASPTGRFVRAWVGP